MVRAEEIWTNIKSEKTQSSQPRLLQQSSDLVEANPDDVETLFRNRFVDKFVLKPLAKLQHEFEEGLVVDHLHALAGTPVHLDCVGSTKVLKFLQKLGLNKATTNRLHLSPAA